MEKSLTIGLTLFCIGLTVILISIFNIFSVNGNMPTDIPPFLSPTETAIYVYFLISNTNSQLLPWNSTLYIGIFTITISIILAMLGAVSSRNQRNYTTETEPWNETQGVSTEPRPVVREVVEKGEVVFTRCKYCGAKVLETETICPNCGAEL
ncbi:MAG: zinc ribbon domain-containing protein [Candidatus Freyarchaeum deiterrae]